MEKRPERGQRDRNDAEVTERKKQLVGQTKTRHKTRERIGRRQTNMGRE